MTEENPRLGTQVLVWVGNPPNERVEFAHIPPELPLVPPPDLPSMLPLFGKASKELGGLDALSRSWSWERLSSLLRIYISREATFSSQIEGTQTSLQELLVSEDKRADAMKKKPENLFDGRSEDLIETSNYVLALNYGLEQLSSPDGLSLGSQLLCKLHEILFQGSERGKKAYPGKFREEQNWIGDEHGFISYVPPPPEQMNACLDNFESQLHDTESSLPLLVRVAILHAQFETIHPFCDGNGRVGRLLIVLLLYRSEDLHEPSLYLSRYFKQHRAEYYERLNGIRREGGWEAWIEFFLRGVRDTALDARIRSEKIQKILDRDHKSLMANPKATKTTLAVYDVLAEGRIVRASSLARKLECTPPPVYHALEILEEMRIVREGSGRTNNRWFEYREYMELLNEDTKPLPR